MQTNKNPVYKLIHIRLPAEIHRKLRLVAADRSESMQRYVEDLITRHFASNVAIIPMPTRGSEK